MIVCGLFAGGLGLVALASVVCQLLVLAGVLRSLPMRRRLARRQRRDARWRACATLDVDTHRKWQRIAAVVERAPALGLRHAELESLLDTFVNVALALHQAASCAAKTDAELPNESGGPVDDITRERRRARGRIDGAIAALRAELELTGQLVCALCESAIADRCESCAELWRADVKEAQRLCAAGDEEALVRVSG